MRVKSDDLKGKYPPTACNAAKDSFLGHPRNTGELLVAGLSNWEKQAVNEYTANMELQKHGKKKLIMELPCNVSADTKKMKKFLLMVNFLAQKLMENLLKLKSVHTSFQIKIPPRLWV